MAQSFDERYEDARQRFAGPEGRTAREHWEYLQTPEGRDGYHDFARLIEERDTLRSAAIDLGIGSADIDLTYEETQAVTREVDRAVDVLDGCDGVSEAVKVAFAESMAKVMAGESLRVKLLAAYEMELELSDQAEVPDGVLGRALDLAMQQLRAYSA